MDIIEELVTNASSLGMVKHIQHVMMLNLLQKIIRTKVPGCVVEFGCCKGQTSLLFKKYLALVSSTKEIHVYDSFKGLPKKTEEDDLNLEGFDVGWCYSSRETFEKTFFDSGFIAPKIHQGWFEDIRDDELPKEICFAFLDGDLYRSIMISLKLIYPKLVNRAIVVVHDYEHEILPGVKKACDEFIKDKRDVFLRIENHCAIIEKKKGRRDISLF